MSKGNLIIPDVFREGCEVLKKREERESECSSPPPPPPFTDSSIAPSTPQTSRPSSPMSTIDMCTEMSDVPAPPSPSSSMSSEPGGDTAWILRPSLSPEPSLLEVLNPATDLDNSLSSLAEAPPAAEEADRITLTASWSSSLASPRERLKTKLSTPHLIVVCCYLRYTTVCEYTVAVKGDDDDGPPSFTCTPFDNMGNLPSIAHVLRHDCEEELLDPLIEGLRSESDIYFLVSSSSKSSVADSGDLMKLARFNSNLSENCNVTGSSMMSHRRELETAYLAVENCHPQSSGLLYLNESFFGIATSEDISMLEHFGDDSCRHLLKQTGWGLLSGNVTLVGELGEFVATDLGFGYGEPVSSTDVINALSTMKPEKAFLGDFISLSIQHLLSDGAMLTPSKRASLGFGLFVQS
eukprot:TRINITY_DN4570_c2_g1_i2.p1 TRINITY_DN4570_c2_g1~~TRINITY_DN4570_c2_g1_i2.p1  ORF type:complete len:409 (+),score=78.28 TRINITY_DN4570_c2_g1_i2:27-1253(+)